MRDDCIVCGACREVAPAGDLFLICPVIDEDEESDAWEEENCLALDLEEKERARP